jgi:methyl-accepting chemotaxis protein
MSTQKTQTAFPALPVAATALVATAGAVLMATNLPAYGVFVCLLGLGVSVMLWLREFGLRSRQWETRQQTMNLAQTAAHDEKAQALQTQLMKLQGEWVPHLENQLMSAKNQMESAVSDMAHTFGQVQDRLNQAGSLASDSAGSMDPAGRAVTEQMQANLGEIMAGINKSLNEKASMFEEVKSFINSTDELARMASSVEELAAKTNLLALNAAIEAARAGEEGRGFSIVADEVRKLSMLSAETGQQIRQRVQDISAAARRAGEGGTRMQASDGKLLSAAQDTVNQVIASLDTVSQPFRDASQQIVEQTQQIAQEISQAEAGFDFRDRVSGILSQVDDSLRALQSQIASRRDLDVAELMRQLGSQASALDDHFRQPPPRRVANAPARSPAHSAAPARPAVPAAAPAGKSGDLDITFF